jgi:Uma2 family endonuclease
VIKGELYMSPAPGIAHQQASIALSATLYNYARERGIGRVFEASIDVIQPDLATPVQPDILLILTANLGIVQTANIRGTPDLIVEILSPSTASYDRHTKYGLYAEAGVLEYWLVDPESCSADIYTRRGSAFVPLGHYERNGVIHSELLPDLRIAMSELCGL